MSVYTFKRDQLVQMEDLEITVQMETKAIRYTMEACVFMCVLLINIVPFA